MPSSSGTPLPKLHAAVFDLDDCLYQVEEIRLHVSEMIVQYMMDHLGFTDRENATAKCSELYMQYGTTYAGLASKGYSLDSEHFHSVVHETIDYEQYLKPDPELRDLLLSVKLPRFVFTNADDKHAQRCLELLGITDCFEGTVHFENLQEEAEASGISHKDFPVVCKPHALSFHLALRLIHKFNLSVPPPPSWPYHPCALPLKNYIFFDDSARNIPAAVKLGMFGVLIRPDASPDIQCSHAADSLLDLKKNLPELFNNPELRFSAPVAMHAAAGTSSGTGFGAAHHTNNSAHLEPAALLSDPLPAVGTTSVAPATHNIAFFNAPDVLSHQVQPSEQLADDALAQMAVEVSSHELAPHPCDSHYVSADIDTPATNGAVQHVPVSTGTNGVHGANAQANMHAVAAHELDNVRRGLQGAAAGVNGAAEHAGAGAEGPPARPRGAGSSAMCEAGSSAVCQSSTTTHDSCPPSPHVQSASLHAGTDQGGALIDKVATFLAAIRQSVNARETASCIGGGAGTEEQEVQRWGSELVDSDLEDLLSHHVVHANSVQEAIEAEVAHQEDQFLIRELGGLSRDTSSFAIDGDGEVGLLGGLGAGWQTLDEWNFVSGLGVTAEAMEDERAEGNGDVQNLPEGLRRAARAGRHVWVQKRA